MSSNTEYDQARRSQLLYFSNIAAMIAANADDPDDSARSWDDFEGVMFPTNRDKRAASTLEVYKSLFEEFSEFPPIIPSLPKHKLLDWHRIFRFDSHSKPSPSKSPASYYWMTTSSQVPVDLVNTAQDAEQDDGLMLLCIAFSTQISELEKDVSPSIRDSIRARLQFLLTSSMEEHSDEQDLLKMSSVRTLYEFLAYSQATTVPSLTLTWDGHIYAQWRETEKRAVGARFVDPTRVDYVIRNLPERFSASSRPARFSELLDSLGLNSLVGDKTGTRAL